MFSPPGWKVPGPSPVAEPGPMDGRPKDVFHGKSVLDLARQQSSLAHPWHQISEKSGDDY
jgi:hypothetical protein